MANSNITQEYKGIKLVDIPSGLGGTLPAAIAGEPHSDGLVPVICLHSEFYTNWLMVCKPESLRPMSSMLNTRMKRIINSRLVS